MITINFTNEPNFDEIAKAGITMICDENMNLKISKDDYRRLKDEFEAAYMDSFIVKDDVNKSIGQRIQELRKEAGITQAQLAEKCGMAQPNIARIEAGTYATSLDVLSRIAEALGKRIELV